MGVGSGDGGGEGSEIVQAAVTIGKVLEERRNVIINQISDRYPCFIIAIIIIIIMIEYDEIVLELMG